MTKTNSEECDLDFLLRSTDRFGYLMPSLIGSALHIEAASLGLVEDFQLTIRKITGSWPRLTAAGNDANEQLLPACVYSAL